MSNWIDHINSLYNIENSISFKEKQKLLDHYTKSSESVKEELNLNTNYRSEIIIKSLREKEKDEEDEIKMKEQMIRLEGEKNRTSEQENHINENELKRKEREEFRTIRNEKMKKTVKDISNQGKYIIKKSNGNGLIIITLLVLGYLILIRPGILKEEYYEKGYSLGQKDGDKKGYDVGYNEGYDEGHDEGYDEGKNKGFDEGWDVGYDSGYDSGYDKGYYEGYYRL